MREGRLIDGAEYLSASISSTKIAFCVDESSLKLISSSKMAFHEDERAIVMVWSSNMAFFEDEPGCGRGRPFDRLRDRSAGDSGPVVRQAHHPARPALRQAQGPVGRLGGRWFDKLTIRPDRSLRQAQRPARYPFFCISEGVAPNSLAKQRVKYLGSLKPTS